LNKRKKKILIVDDEQNIRELLAQILSEHYQVFFAQNGDEAIAQAKKHSPALIVLDILMPGKSGFQTCTELRSDPATKMVSVLILTALNDPEQRTQAFLCGADDYLNKPFLPDELLARIQSKIRRSNEINLDEGRLVQFGDLTLNYEELKVAVAGKPLEVGPIEFRILNCLIKNEGKLVGRDILSASVWGDEAPSERALDPHITALRKKLKNSLEELKTVYGRGYSLVIKENAV